MCLVAVLGVLGAPNNFLEVLLLRNALAGRGGVNLNVQTLRPTGHFVVDRKKGKKPKRKRKESKEALRSCIRLKKRSIKTMRIATHELEYERDQAQRRH